LIKVFGPMCDEVEIKLRKLRDDESNIVRFVETGRMSGGACSTHGKIRKHQEYWFKVRLRDRGTDEMIILKLILKK